MTRFLSEALGAEEPTFSRSIQQLERAAGRPGTDIRLTASILQQTRTKLAALGLDPEDTTGPELYAALLARLRRDEETARTALHIAESATPTEATASVLDFLRMQTAAGGVFALKTSVAKRMLKKKPPKVAMKRLGYRSVDSMLKHESAAELYMAALICESAAWQRGFREQYARLGPSDFETKKIALIHPASKRWQVLAQEYVTQAHHTMMSFPELGAVVILPMQQAVDGLAITTLLLVAEEMNGIRSHSSYAKLQQVKPDFGKIVQKTALSEPYTSARLAGQPVPWRMIQRYYARFTNAYHPEVFEPHVQSDDLVWTSGEELLTRLHPDLAFWDGAAALGLLHDGAIVSCNVLDVALSYCNQLSFSDRIVHFVRDTVWHELMMRYLNEENLEAAVHQQLAGELAPPLVQVAEEAYNGAEA
jgi:hypothetical protein